MSKGGLLCSLVLLQVCIIQLSLISGSQLPGGQIEDKLLCPDPIQRARLMSSHGHHEFDGHNADSTFEEELADEDINIGDEYVSDDGGVRVRVPMAGGEAAAEEEEGLLSLDVEEGLPSPDFYDHGGDSCGAKDSSFGSGGDVECPECGKFFKNDKSMFGHLRSHPNRGYKGTIPPMRKLKLSPETAATSSSLQGTDQPYIQHSGRDPRLTPLEVLCAYSILTLKYRDNGRATKQVAPPPSFGKFDAIRQAEGAIGGPVTSNAAAEFKWNNAGAESANQGCDEFSSFTVNIPKKRRNMPKEIREAHRKKAKLVPTSKEKRRAYVCKHCKAEFSTHQALGGHMAGHHREKKVPALKDFSFRAHRDMAAASQNGKQQVRGGGDDDNRWRNDDLSLQRGLLSEQSSMALSGQASGGQMRQHSESRNHDLSPAVAEPKPTPRTPTDDGDGRKLLNIDLNVEALEQE